MPHSIRPISIKSLAGSPVLKPADLPENIKELRSISNGTPTDFDFLPSAHESSEYEAYYREESLSQEATSSSPETAKPVTREDPKTSLLSLPYEIHEQILEIIFGPTVSMASPSATSNSSPRSWSKSPPSPRRKILMDLALVCRSWTQIVQGRIYRQSELTVNAREIVLTIADSTVVRLEGTMKAMFECRKWFLGNRHLISHVRRVDVWIPVWGRRSYTPVPRVLDRRRNHHQLFMSRAMGWEEETHPTYDIPFLNSEEGSTIEEIFHHMQLFTSARILILQGGHAHNPPEVRHFRDEAGDESRRRLPRLPHIETVVLRGAWNLVRTHQQWTRVSQALPALRECHCTYPTPRSDVDSIIIKMLNRRQKYLRHVNLTLEGIGGVAESEPGSSQPVCPEAVCVLLGYAAFRLETLAFTGTVCQTFFRTLHGFCKNAQWPSRLRSLDVSVLGCCPDRSDPSVSPEPLLGITNLKFIHAFESLVIEAVKCLEFTPDLTHVNIRFLDVSPTCPQLKPYFELTNNQCSGLWSPAILDALHQSRPAAKFVELEDGIYPRFGEDGQVVGIMAVSRRPLSVLVCRYELIAS